MEVTLKHSRTHPKYLNSNSTSHKWPFGAIAELADNAVDAKAKKFELDTGVVQIEDQAPVRYISCQDDGTGMTPGEVHRMMSFGHCNKVETKGQVPIGQYGNGFKSGSMRIGDDVIVFTKQKNTRTVGFLSQSFLKIIDAQEVFVPMATWNKDWKLYDSADVDSKQSLESLRIIQKHSIFKTDEEIVEEFEKIEGEHGTRIVIMNLKRSGKNYEFNFDIDPHDIQLAEDREIDIKKKKKETELAIPTDEYSLRAYFRILYMNPRMKMYIRGKKVLSKRMLYSLYMTKEIPYRPKLRGEDNEKIETRVVFGFTKEHKEHYGMMYYHKNRLISRYHKIGMMNTHGSRGVGVVGIIDCYFLTPTHNKQDFVYGDRYRTLIETVKNKLRKYWLSCNIDAGRGMGIRKFWEDLEKVKHTGPFWIQCDNCLSWRRIRKPAENYPSSWVCVNNTDKKYNSCKIPEEPETGFPLVKLPKILNKKNSRKDSDDDLDDEEESIDEKPKTPPKRKTPTPKNIQYEKTIKSRTPSTKGKPISAKKKKPPPKIKTEVTHSDSSSEESNEDDSSNENGETASTKKRKLSQNSK